MAKKIVKRCALDSNLLIWGCPNEPPFCSVVEPWKPRRLSNNHEKFTDLIEENCSICAIQCFESHVIVVCRSGH